MKVEKPYQKRAEEIISILDSHPDGLEENEAKSRLEEIGENKIKQEDSSHPILLFLSQFKSGLVYVLIVAAVVAAVFGHWLDVGVIVVVLLINAVMGFIQEYKAERAMEALKNMIVPTTKVFRAGELLEIPAEKLVPGDIVLLEEGDKVPADMRLCKVKNFRTKEAPLTGESKPIRKSTEVLEGDVDLGDRKNMAWMGTFVAGGRARGIVTATGSDTAFGKIAEDIGSIEKSGGHFEKKVNVLTKKMAAFAFTGAGLIFIISAIREGVRFSDFQTFEEPLFSSIAALVSGIPEGLPAILVIVLAAGATRMANRNAVIRKLPATETLGVADHILTDKTGTVTQNTMTVREVRLPDGKPVEVTGQGWEPKGEFYRNGEMISPLENNDLTKLLHISGICNRAELAHKKNNTDEYNIIGDPTEGGLVVLTEKAGLKKEIIERHEEKLDDLPFNSDLKLRASLVEIENHKEVYVVGAPEAVINRAARVRSHGSLRKLTDQKRKELLEEVEEMSSEAMRTICLAYKRVGNGVSRVTEDMLDGLVISGVVGMIDPPRPGVKDAVSRAKRAGVRVVMATGDHKKTAASIAKKVGIESKEGYPKALDQSELERMSDVEFRDKVKNVNVFARLTPHMKLKIAKVLQDEGATLAMTGDGVNDAPAVKQADIGISMGIMGTDVTKEASEIVLADDNFASIMNAIEEGRIVFENTRKSSSSLITSNFAEISTIIVFLLTGLPLPLLPTQILWVNLVTDGVVGVPLALEPKHEEILNRPPRDKEENILTLEIVPYFLLMTALMAAMTYYIFIMLEGGYGLDKARTGAFSVIAFTQLFNAINLRSIRRSVFDIGFFSNKYMILGLMIGIVLQLSVIWIPALQNLFHFEALTLREVILIVVLSSFVFWMGELYKKVRYNLKI